MAGIILLEAVESLQPKLTVQSTSDFAAKVCSQWCSSVRCTKVQENPGTSNKPSATVCHGERSMSLVDLGKKLLESARLGETEEVRALMTNGAPFTTDWLGTSPLHMAAQFGHISTAEVLIRAGISRDARTKVDRTPLHVAAQEGHADIVELLLKNGADIEAKDMLKMTPLHWAVERGHISVIELLLEYDADIHSLSKFEKTPVSVALDNGRLDIVQLLTSGQMGKRTALDETEESTELISAAKLDENDLVASVEEQDDVTLHTAAGTIKGIPVRPILLHANLSNIKNEVKEDSEIEEETSDQGSTSVLATLAALAETMGPLTAQAGNSVSAAETLQWLEQHGITMLSGDNSTIITSALESGQTISLTEAGKLALNWTKKQNSSNSRNADNAETPTLEQTIENVVANMSNQKVITIVTDQSQIPSLVSGASSGSIVVMANSDLDPSGQLMSVTLDSTQEDMDEPEPKKFKRGPLAKDDSLDDLANLDRNQLAQRLEEAQRKAREYEEQLRMKEHEAAEYKKRLDSISSQALAIKK